MTMSDHGNDVQFLPTTEESESSGNHMNTADVSDQEQKPSLPPRPKATSIHSGEGPNGPLRPMTASRPQLQSGPTTALSSIDIQTLAFPDGTRGTFDSNAQSITSSGTERPSLAPASRKVSRNGSIADDSASLMSYVPTMQRGGDLDSLLGDNRGTQSPAWKLLSSQADTVNPFETIEIAHDDQLANFQEEFEDIPEVNSRDGNEGMRNCFNGLYTH